MPSRPPPLTWLEPGQDFPPVNQAWGDDSAAPGLLGAGGILDVETLRRAYSKGVFPWYSQGQPTLWWSPNPRMVLDVSNFRMHPSFKKTLQKFQNNNDCEIRIDSAFAEVINACSKSPRAGQAGTWIVPDMMAAYSELHWNGLAHSVETWINGKLAGGLYCVSLGKSVFGESMFSHSSNASKIALAALVSFCRFHSIKQIDCQQNTQHLASLGAREISRDSFVEEIQNGLTQNAPPWHFETRFWHELLP